MAVFNEALRRNPKKPAPRFIVRRCPVGTDLLPLTGLEALRPTAAYTPIMPYKVTRSHDIEHWQEDQFFDTKDQAEQWKLQHEDDGYHIVSEGEVQFTDDELELISDALRAALDYDKDHDYSMFGADKHTRLEELANRY